MHATIATLLVGATLTTGPMAAAAHCHFRCVERCEWERCYDRCVRCCLEGGCRQPTTEPYRPRHLLPRRVRPGPERYPQAESVELFLRLPPEALGGGLLGIGFLILRAISWALRRRDLREADELRCQARARRREADDLDAHSDTLRRRHDI
jgi:hypothetical protein